MPRRPLHAGALRPEEVWKPSFADLLRFETFRPQLLQRYEADHRWTDRRLAAHMEDRHQALMATAIQNAYDSIDVAALPNNGSPVCVYQDGYYVTTAAAVARFSGPVVWITVLANGAHGLVDDCEQGNAGPSYMPGWATARRAAGVEPTVYCGQNTWWSQIIQAFESAGVAQPNYWVANYTYNAAQAIPAGAIGIQWSDQGGGGSYDVSNFVNPWPGVQTAPAPAPDPAPAPAPTPTPSGGDDLPKVVIGSGTDANHGAGAVFVTDGLTKRYVATNEESTALQALFGTATKIDQYTLDRITEVSGVPSGQTSNVLMDPRQVMYAADVVTQNLPNANAQAEGVSLWTMNVGTPQLAALVSQVAAIKADTDATAAAIKSSGATVDLTPVLNAVAALAASVQKIETALESA